MMNDPRGPRQATPERAGLCARCTHLRVVPGARGAEFYLCQLSFTDSRFRRYPAIPVLTCPGFAKRSTAP
jgi:hypothetical protein